MVLPEMMKPRRKPGIPFKSVRFMVRFKGRMQTKLEKSFQLNVFHWKEMTFSCAVRFHCYKCQA